ncbi:MAG: TetR/AcrR family transcriptional regulator [bacterium]|nr:TetR/AcrR family transcriptional regulator [bacterium]
MAPRKVNKREKREQIIAAAARIFAEQGLQQSTIANIARAADIGKGTVYEYFPSKQALFFAVMEWFQSNIVTEAEPLIEVNGQSEGGAGACLRRYIGQMMGHNDELRELFPLWMEFWSAAGTGEDRQEFAEALRRMYGDFRRHIAGILAEGRRSGEFSDEIEPDTIAAVLAGTLDGLYLQAWFDQTFDPAAAADHFILNLLRGISRQC